MSIWERLANLRRDWFGGPREIRMTAIGWQPSADYQEDCGPTPSGEREFYIVVRGNNHADIHTPAAPTQKRR